MLHSYLLTENFKQSLADNCVYTKITEKSKVIVIVWVDDIIIASDSEEKLESVKEFLSRKFKMKDLNEISWFLGIEFKHENGCITMNQAKYIMKLLERFQMTDCKPKATPCNSDVVKLKDEDSTYMEDPRLYREIVGSLIYIMTGTRPDLCYVVTKLSQHMSKPTKAHLILAKNALKYLKGTLKYGLKFEKANENLNLIGYCDLDWGGSEDRKSLSGYNFQLGHGGSLISWKSKRQQCVALSTCEAEYIALSHAIQEAKFLKQLLSDMKGGCEIYTLLNVDNQGAIALAKNPVYHQRSKHIDIKYHFIRSEVQKGSVELKYVPTELNNADAFTKPLSKRKLCEFIALHIVT